MKPKINKLLKKSKLYLRRGSPTVLTFLGAAGVIATSVLAVRVTPKAVHKIRADSRINHDGDPEAFTKAEAIRSAWICYIPAAITGTATIVCIFGANILNKHQQAAISSAYALVNNAYSEYRTKLKELYGEEAHQKIIDAIAKEKSRDVYISSSGICSSSSLAFDERNSEDMRLFYDSYSRRYFESTVPQVLEAEYHLNRNWILGACVTINDFYEFLGIAPIEGGDDAGWFWEDGITWIDFNHHKTVLDDGLEVYVIDLEYAPKISDDY